MHFLGDEDEAEAYVASVCFKTGPPGRVGVELEWLVRDITDAARSVDRERTEKALASVTDLPSRGLVTFEPGGQLELSTLPQASLDACVAAASGDLAVLRAALAGDGLHMVGSGLDPLRPPLRFLDHPRYAAMEEFFDRFGPDGRIMMCTSASVQVCLDAGLDTVGPLGFTQRWRLAHTLGPVLVAAFANSPFRDGCPTGWRSTRQLVWSRLEPSRTHPPAGADPRAAWARYAIDARVLCIRRDDGSPWTAPAGFTFREWLRDGGPRPPTRADLDYHLTTLFPPVRPRGHLEIRYIDAQPHPDWVVPLAVATALFDDPVAAEAARAATESLQVLVPASRTDRSGNGAGAACSPELYAHAARRGLSDPVLAAAAQACFAAAADALSRMGASASVRQAVSDFTDRYVARARCPADDLLDAWRAGRDPIGGPSPNGLAADFGSEECEQC